MKKSCKDNKITKYNGRKIEGKRIKNKKWLEVDKGENNKMIRSEAYGTVENKNNTLPYWNEKNKK